jgi:hypothetical protein
VPEVTRVFDFPPDVFITPSLERALARELATDGYVPPDFDDLRRRVPQLDQWEWLEDYGDKLLAECIRIQPVALEKWASYRSEAALQQSLSGHTIVGKSVRLSRTRRSVWRLKLYPRPVVRERDSFDELPSVCLNPRRAQPSR